MASIYIVTDGIYEVEVVCAFSTEERARAYCDTLNSRGWRASRSEQGKLHWDKFELDPQIPDEKEG